MDADHAREQSELATLEQTEAELVDVETALLRLDDGTYGTCEACGSAIDDDHLAVHPAARLCAEHRNAV